MLLQSFCYSAHVLLMIIIAAIPNRHNLTTATITAESMLCGYRRILVKDRLYSNKTSSCFSFCCEQHHKNIPLLQKKSHHGLIHNAYNNTIRICCCFMTDVLKNSITEYGLIVRQLNLPAFLSLMTPQNLHNYCAVLLIIPEMGEQPLVLLMICVNGYMKRRMGINV